jgi:hypothetical protein
VADEALAVSLHDLAQAATQHSGSRSLCAMRGSAKASFSLRHPEGVSSPVRERTRG